MNEFITAGGIFMWPLLACSVLIIAFSIERSWFLQKDLFAQMVYLIKLKH